MWLHASYTGRFVEMAEFSGDSREQPRAKVSRQIGASASLGLKKKAPSELCSRKSSLTCKSLLCASNRKNPGQEHERREQAQ